MNKEEAIQSIVNLLDEIDGSRFPDEGLDGETIWNCTVGDKTLDDAFEAKAVLLKSNPREL